MRRASSLLLVGAILFIPVGANAYTLREAGNGDPVRWHQDRIRFRVDESLADVGSRGEIKRALVSGFQSWGSIPGSPFVFDGDAMPDQQLGTGSRMDGVTDIALVRQGWEHDPTFVALTLVTYEPGSGRIMDADVLLNGQNFQFGISPSSDQGYDLGNVFTHELGHLLGFGHSDEEEATMYASSRPGETRKRDLYEDDEEGFYALYLGNDAGSAGAGCSTVPSQSPAQFGWLLVMMVGLLALRARRAVAVAVAGLVVLVAPVREADAAVVEYQSTAQLARRATHVFRGLVVRRQALWANGVIVTDVTVRVEDCWKGQCGSTLVVRELGGELDGIGMLPPEPSPLPVAEAVVIFAAERAGRLFLVGGAQGTFRLDPATEIGRRDLTSARMPSGVRVERVLSLRRLRSDVREALAR